MYENKLLTFLYKGVARCTCAWGNVRFNYLWANWQNCGWYFYFYFYCFICTRSLFSSFSAIIGSFLAIAMLSLINIRPPLEEIVTWIEYNTLALLFGMMYILLFVSIFVLTLRYRLIVGIFSTTGFFEWVALKAYEISKGRVWRYITFKKKAQILSTFIGWWLFFVFLLRFLLLC